MSKIKIEIPKSEKVAERPCYCDKDSCNLCWKAKYHPGYRRIWGLDTETYEYEEVSQTMVSKTKRFLESRKKWAESGKPLRSMEEIKDIYDNICSECPLFKNDTCTVCGCNIKRNTIVLNKLAMATEQCPLDPPKWKAKTTVDKLSKKDQKIVKKKKKGCGCKKGKKAKTISKVKQKKKGG